MTTGNKVAILPAIEFCSAPLHDKNDVGRISKKLWQYTNKLYKYQAKVSRDNEGGEIAIVL